MTLPFCPTYSTEKGSSTRLDALYGHNGLFCAFQQNRTEGLVQSCIFSCGGYRWSKKVRMVVFKVWVVRCGEVGRMTVSAPFFVPLCL